MKLNPLADALALAEKRKPAPQQQQQQQPPPPAPPAPPPPAHPSLLENKVEGGLIKRVPIDRTAAIVISKAPWWAHAPYVAPEITAETTVPELRAKLDQAVAWIKKLEQINAKLREQVRRAKEETHSQAKELGLQIETLTNHKEHLEAQVRTLSEKAKIADLYVHP